ncbi:FAD-linked oxidoreductase [Microbacteriaceae bacterium SG_E_30_P1]|uniref:FAD-linked oxidoreductase n=1 Tax=Antiquaquibacter oligotrophicus TaxID=2880260 RepID=A0ABT6KK23_9MICO|nr:D-arabinono-1,4-lactone oxidase [Antiquaquibacter oligotrophicus]MDH6180321.1 FAD-linked oxidoreductase [Antiquaquibacter oligotrophicus]UDF13933.1 FAD-binding protein [Antiquaquibacter oligotrophicus]
MTIQAGSRWQNWGRSVEATPQFVGRANTVGDVVDTLTFARERGTTVRAIGAGHSFTPIAATEGVLLDVSGLRGLLGVDGRLVTLGAGTHLHELPELLAPHGLALENMGDINVQTIAGALSTGTHGTGARFGGLATQVRGATIVTASGELLHIDRDHHADLLPAIALGLGALGVLVAVQLECVPEFVLSAVERPEPAETVLAEWEQRIAEHDHFEFYSWPHADLVSTKTNTRLPADAQREPLGPMREWFDNRFMSNTVFRLSLEMLRAMPAMIPPMNRLSVRLEADRAFSDYSWNVFSTVRTTRFREMEYAIPVAEVPAALREVHDLIERKNWKISFPIEVRASAADDLWLSTAAGRPTGYIAVHRYWKDDEREYFREVEAIMRAHDGRPHWGKMNSRTADDLRPSYPRFDDFLAARDRLDPDRLFQNPYLARVLGA